MSDDKKQNFVQVNYDLLATKKLNSTQKLFISYIIGWQKNNLICKETNNNLASRFGMSYSGIRTVLNDLNKYDFFDSVQKDYNRENGTSGHEITVDEAKLKLFLNEGNKTGNNISTGPEIELLEKDKTEHDIGILDDLEIESEENPSILQYQNSDIVNVKTIMTYLGFTNDEVDIFRAKIKSENVTFEDFSYLFSGICLSQKLDSYVGLRISKDQYELFNKIIIDNSLM
nr:hypothetical protein [uncultured Flavobacterium sp.]